MMITALPMLAFTLAGAAGEQVSTPRDAQARLAETLASADSVAWVRADVDGEHTITFAIDRGGESFRVIATTDDGSDDHRVVALTILDTGTPSAREARSELSWLVTEMHDVTAVRTLAVDGNGHVTLGTSDGRRYAARPHHGPKGNAGAAARWTAAWDA